MILTILFIILVEILVPLGIFLNHKFYLETLPAICFIISGLLGLGIIFGTAFGILNTVTYDTDHANAIEEYNTIVYRLEKQEKLDTNYYNINGGVYADALEFNKKVRHYKKYGANPWTNWFHGWAYEGLEEIDIIKYSGGDLK